MNAGGEGGSPGRRGSGWGWPNLAAALLRQQALSVPVGEEAGLAVRPGKHSSRPVSLR